MILTLGLRVAQSVAGAPATIFVWDWGTPVPELLQAGTTVYLVGLDTLAWEDAGTWVYALTDALGSVRQETDEDGNITVSREWSPFGVAKNRGQAGPGFTGEWEDDAVGLLYLRARWYDGAVGRFTQRDPVDVFTFYRYLVGVQ